MLEGSLHAEITASASAPRDVQRYAFIGENGPGETEIKIYREIFVSRSIINEGTAYYQILLVTGPLLRYCNLRY